MHIPRGRRHWDNKKTLFWTSSGFMVLWVMFCGSLCIMFLFWTCILLMLLCFIECMFGWSIDLLCDRCSHFYMTVLVFDQVAHMFYIMFTWSQFTCYIILVLLLLALPWGSNVFCASVYLEGLMCFVQVFQVTSIYVPSASQLLITLKGINFMHF